MLWVGFGPELSNLYFWESLEISSGKRPGSLLGDFRFVDLGAESLREIAPKKLREFQKVSARLVRKSLASFRKSPRDWSEKASRVSESLREIGPKKLREFQKVSARLFEKGSPVSESLHEGFLFRAQIPHTDMEESRIGLYAFLYDIRTQWSAVTADHWVRKSQRDLRRILDISRNKGCGGLLRPAVACCGLLWPAKACKCLQTACQRPLRVL